MDDSAGPSWGLVLFIFLLIIDFIFSMYSRALTDVSDNFLDEAGRNGDVRAGQVHRMKDGREHFDSACWFYLLLTVLPIGLLVLGRQTDSEWQKIGPMLISLLVIYVFGLALPRMFGRKYAESTVLRCCGFVRFFTAVSFPFTFVMTKAAMLIAFLFGVRRKDLDEEMTEDEILSVVNEGHEQGVLDKNETEMITNIFEFDDKQARDIMTHRKDIEGLDAELTLKDAVTAMAKETNSRFPVYEETIDNIIGVLHYRDAMRFLNMEQYNDTKIRDIPGLLLPVKFIPETRSISVLFRSMQAQKLQMVIVVDEYGETAGLVTMEDILEEIVGNIFDEYDEDEARIIREDDGSWIMDGMTPLEEVEEELSIDLHDEEHETLNGYLIYRLDRIPDEHENSVITAEGYSFRIMEVKNNTIRWAHVTKLKEEPAAEEDGGKEKTESKGSRRESGESGSGLTDSKKDEV